jgi:regulator of sigma E protease
MAVIYTIFSFLVAIIILVGVHEFGHFYVARRCGVQVLRFSLGFGKVIWRCSDRFGTEYTLCVLPLGGYVKMLDEREGEVPQDLLTKTFNSKTVLQRMAIFVAGPAANFVLALLLFWGLFLPGETGLIPVIGSVKMGSLAATAGLVVGQEIVAVDGTETPTTQIVEQQLIRRLGQSGSIVFRVRDVNSTLLRDVQLPLNKWMQGMKDPDPLAGLGVEIPFIAALVGEVLPKSPAEKAGIKTGDKVIRVNEQAVFDWRDCVNYIRTHPNQALTIALERLVGGAPQTISLQVTPESFIEQGVSYGRIGIGRQAPSEELYRHYDYSIGGALLASVNKVWGTAGFVLLSVKKLILGEISTKNLSGPISIAKVAGASAHSGLLSFIGFLATLSVLLGVFNLLPIPMLDGGHLAYLLAEALRGKPVSEKLQILGFQLGLMLVVGLSILALFNDITRF